jgi:hypothetical protein
MPRVEFEATTPVFQRAKTVDAIDRTATVIGFLKGKAVPVTGRGGPYACETSRLFSPRKIPGTHFC